MRVLIVEDQTTSTELLKRTLSPYGHCDVAIDGKEAIEAFYLAWEEDQPYDLICLDIIMPEMDGREVLKAIRKKEKEMGIRGLDGVTVIMTTVLADSENIMGAFRDGCEAYIVKPIDEQKLLQQVRDLGLISLEIS